MRIFKVCLIIVALATPIASARAQEGGGDKAVAAGAQLPRDQGWNAGSWALLFDLNNFFQNETFFNDHGFAQLGVGFEYFIDSKMALRVGASYGYQSNPFQVTKHTSETGGTTPVVEYTPQPTDPNVPSFANGNPSFNPTGSNPGPTSQSDFRARVDFLYRFMANAVAPYAGAGVFFDWRNAAIDYKDDATVVNQITTVHDYQRKVGGGLRGVLGAEWRLHPSFSLFAEYSLDVTLISQQSTETSHTREVTAGGERTVARETTSRKSPAKFATDTTLTHAGQLGLAVHF